MKKQYTAPELERVRFKLSNAMLFDDLVYTSGESPNGRGNGMGEELEPEIDLDSYLDGYGF